jgi:HD-like signal output (HDOD) protein
LGTENNSSNDIMTKISTYILDQILLSIDQDDFVLPTLPDVASRLQELIDDPNVSVDQVLLSLSIDPVVSAQIIKSANGTAFDGLPQVESVREAASRLGFRKLRNLVITITMSKMLRSKNPIINQRINELWIHSREMAALCYVIAQRYPHLSPEHAMIVGLVHDIGLLPLYLQIEKGNMLLTTDELECLIEECHEEVGSKLLKKWNFPQDIVEAVADHDDIHRDASNSALPDYMDVVTFANLLGSDQAIVMAWNNVSAVSRLGLSVKECQTFMEINADHIELVKSMFGMPSVDKFKNICPHPSNSMNAQNKSTYIPSARVIP